MNKTKDDNKNHWIIIFILQDAYAICLCKDMDKIILKIWTNVSNRFELFFFWFYVFIAIIYIYNIYTMGFM